LELNLFRDAVDALDDLLGRLLPPHERSSSIELTGLCLTATPNVVE
jgi:hypothetical protein